MIKILPIILVIALVLGGLYFWRSSSNKPGLVTSESTQGADNAPIEVPKTLPNLSIEDKVKDLEGLVTKLVTQVNGLKSTPAQSSSYDTRISTLEASVIELKARVSVLEKTNPSSAISSGSTIYIPLGSGGQWNNVDWTILPEYEVSLNPANFPNYTGMTLEVVFRVVDPSGTASIRLYNVTDGSAVSSQIDTTSSTFSSYSSASFKLATGIKTYRLQIKSTGEKYLIIQTARIKVTF